MTGKPPENKELDARVLARRQKDLEGYTEKHQAILDARAIKYAQEIAPQWERVRASVTKEIKAIYLELEDAQGVPITQQPIREDKYRNMQRQLERLNKLESQLEEIIAKGTAGTQKKLRNNVSYSFAESYYYHAYGLEQAAQIAVQVPVLTQGTVIGTLINPWLPDGATYSDRLRANTKYLAKKLAAIVEEASGNGWSINRTARETQERAQEGFYNSVRLARTEMTRAAAQGANHVYMQNADIMDGKRWNATLDSKTAPKDAANDGEIFPLDYDIPENPGEPGKRIPNHPNCRCKWTPVLSALGVSTKERIARDEKGKRTYTQARSYKEYAKERGLPNVDDRVRNEDPRRYLRRGETKADIPKDFFEVFKGMDVTTKAVTTVAAVEVATQAAAMSFVPAKTINEANSWASDNLQHIKKVEYKGFDLELANSINEELYNLRQLYPEIEGINFVGTAQQRNKDLHARQVAEFLKINAKVFKGHPQAAIDATVKKHVKKPPSVPKNVYAQAADKSWGDQAGIAVNQTWAKDYDKWKQSVARDVSTGWHPEGTESPVSVIIHEFGHSIDYFLKDVGLRDKYITPITKEAMRDRDLGKELSRYATTDEMEVVAEAFSEYRLNPNPRKYARLIGEAIDQALDEYRRTNK